MTDIPSKPYVRYGVHSEVGTLRKVLVCSPGLAHTRLTPTNCDELLFDDVLWVQNAKRDHFDFVAKMRERGVEVVEKHNLLSETLDSPAAKKWILDRVVVANEVGLGLVEETRSFLESLDSGTLAGYLLGGLSTIDLPEKYASDSLKLAHDASGITEYLLPPLPNTLYTPRYHLLDLRWCDAQSAVLAGSSGRNHSDRRNLQIPPKFHRS